MLEAVGVSVWRDTKDLWPGQNWEDQIRAAIKSESLAFIACFSEHTAAKTKTYQNLELVLAADEYRLRPPSTDWLLPVRFSECVVPDYNLGAGRTLGSIQRTDLFGESETLQTIRLAEVVKSGNFTEAHFHQWAVNYGSVTNDGDTSSLPDGGSSTYLANNVDLSGSVLTVGLTLWVNAPVLGVWVYDAGKTADCIGQYSPDTRCFY